MAVDKPRDRPTLIDVIPLVRAVYARHCAGCCLHIVTDDDNFEQGDAEFCLQQARGCGHDDCIAAAELLVQLTNTQRHKLHQRYDEYATPLPPIAATFYERH